VKIHEDVPPPSPVYEVSASEVGPIEHVTTLATWRGGRVILSDEAEPGRFGFYSDDAELAARESLHGDQYSGWTGIAAAEELEDVTETVKVLRDEGKQA
jgi:hypothetical protein